MTEDKHFGNIYESSAYGQNTEQKVTTNDNLPECTRQIRPRNLCIKAYFLLKAKITMLKFETGLKEAKPIHNAADT